MPEAKPYGKSSSGLQSSVEALLRIYKKVSIETQDLNNFDTLS